MLTHNPSETSSVSSTLAKLKEQFAELSLLVGEFRSETTVVVPAENLISVMQFLRDDEACQYTFLSDVIGLDYLNYPAADSLPGGRFAVVYNLVSPTHNRRLFIKVMLDPSLPTDGIEDDPALHLASVTGLWPGAEWPEREVYDMFGIHFDDHPDHRRILTWEDFPAHPLRKDYPVTGHGERERYKYVGREDV